MGKPFALDIGIGLTPPLAGLVGIVLPFVERLPAVLMLRLGLHQFGSALANQRDLLPARGDHGPHLRLGGIDGTWRQLRRAARHPGSRGRSPHNWR